MDFSFNRLFDSAKALAFNNVPTREEVRACRLMFGLDERSVVHWSLPVDLIVNKIK